MEGRKKGGVWMEEDDDIIKYDQRKEREGKGQCRFVVVLCTDDEEVWWIVKIRLDICDEEEHSEGDISRRERRICPDQGARYFV